MNTILLKRSNMIHQAFEECLSLYYQCIAVFNTRIKTIELWS